MPLQILVMLIERNVFSVANERIKRTGKNKLKMKTGTGGTGGEKMKEGTTRDIPEMKRMQTEAENGIENHTGSGGMMNVAQTGTDHHGEEKSRVEVMRRMAKITRGGKRGRKRTDKLLRTSTLPGRGWRTPTIHFCQEQVRIINLTVLWGWMNETQPQATIP